MVEQLTRERIAEKAIIHPAPQLPAVTIVDRSFELPTGLYAATVALLLGFIGVMGWGFANPEMALPLALFTVFIAAGFGVPAVWAMMKPEKTVRAASWGRFRARGIMTNTGHSTAGAATVQVLILPVLIFAWGVAAVTIAALVR